MATVDDLLRRLHRQAAQLPVWSDPKQQLPAQLRGWVQLAAVAYRVLDALDPRPRDSELYGLLRTLRREETGPGQVDAGIANVALILGALGDVITSSPMIVAVAGQAQRSRLQASIQAALHAAARSTLDVAREAGHEHATETLRQIAEITEPAAWLPPSARSSILERITITRVTADTVDVAVQLWVGAAQLTFTNQRLVTGIALQEAAATLALLCQVTAHTFRDAAKNSFNDPDGIQNAARRLGRAAAAWRNAATWPASIQLGGRAYEHHQAVQCVRAALTGPPLARLTLRERTHALRAAVDTAVMIGELQAAAVARAAKSGGLWIAHERPNLRPPGVARRQVKLDWDSMPADHPAGQVLTDRARSAQQALVIAADSLDRAANPRPLVQEATGRIALVEDRIVAKWWETVEPPIPRPEHEALQTATAHRRGIPR